MAVQADHVLYLTAGLFGMAPSRAITNDLTNAANVSVLAAQLGNAQFTKDFYPVFNDAKAAKLADILLGTSVSAETKTAATGALQGMLDANGGNVGSAALGAIEFLLSTSDTNFAAAKTQLQNRVEVATAYVNSKNPTSNLQLTNVTQEAATKTAAIAAIDAPASKSLNLTTGLDNLIGTEANDTFTADFNGNNNTFESGDAVDGGAGSDTLSINLGNASNFAINATTKSVENVVIRAQSMDGHAGSTNAGSNGSNSDNNIYTEQVTVDADRMSGVNRWENNNSRADLVIEDVRIQASQITKDITIAMVDTDPGHVDFGVYFDQQSLRAAAPGKNNSLTLTVGNQLENAKGFDAAKPLDNIPYTSVTFQLNGTAKVIPLDLTSVDTYDQMWTALETAFNTAKAADASLSGLTLTRQVNGNTFFSKDGLVRNADTYVLAVTEGELSVPTGEGWKASGSLPSNNAFSATAEATPLNITPDVVTSTIILDNVGRGSTGGDLVVGGLSVGDTSTSKGVQKFDITVERSSKLQNINSTNNSLEHVIFKNGTVKGDVTVLGNVNDLDANAAVTNGAGALPGTEAQHDAYGLNDVRVVDASTMTGKVNLRAVLGDAVVAKYMNRTDTQRDKNADDAKFQYTLGSNDDTLTLDISASNLEAAGTTNRDDFQLTISGGTGNDSITLNVLDTDNGNGFWYTNSKHNANMLIDGGAGNDTIRTLGAGDVIINAGEGNDTVYADNSGTIGGAWVFNANNNVLADLDGKTIGASSVLYKSTLTVTLAGPTAGGVAGVITPAAVRNNVGFESTVTIETNNYLAGQGEINQAIKKAINSHEVLSKLLVAVDGPDNTVVVKSLVDGVFGADDLAININAANINNLTPTEIQGMNTAYKALNQDSTLANLTQADLNGFAAARELANDPVLASTNGTGSLARSDNTINLGTGNDVAVLGTGALSNDTIVLTGYDNGVNTVVNFSTAGAGKDEIDFGAYLKTQKSASGSTESLKLVPVTVNVDATAEANSVTVLKFNATSTQKLAELTPEKLLSVLNSNAGGVNDPGSATFGGLSGTSLDAEVGVYPSGTVRDHVVMIENSANLGEYKIFHLTSKTGDIAGSFDSAKVIATADFGTSLGATGNYVNLGSIVKGAAGYPGQDAGAENPGGGNNGGGNGNITYTNLSLDGKGSASGQVTEALATGAWNLTDAVATANNVLVTGFGADDKVTISGATAAQYDTAISTGTGGDVTITYNNNGTLNTIVLAGVAGSSVVYDVASFNALANVGDIFFA